MTRPKLKQIPVNLSTSLIEIAMVQMDSAFPSGKTVVVSQGRETFEWVSLSEIELRKEKAHLILDFLQTYHPNTKIIVFPEYSLPVQEIRHELQEKANVYDQIIIAGADNIRQANGQILNQCPVIIPHKKEPVWITKRRLSQWETGKVDEPDIGANPVFNWQVQDNKYVGGREYMHGIFLLANKRFLYRLKMILYFT
jgi:hypothetical protein